MLLTTDRSSSRSLCCHSLLDQLDGNARLIVDFISSTSEPDQGAPPQGPNLTPCLTALIGFEGEQCGMLLLNCSRKTAQRVSSSILGYATSCEDEIVNTVGELVNMLGYDLKRLLTADPTTTRLTLPTVVQADAKLCREVMERTDGTLRCYEDTGAAICIGVTLNASWRTVLHGMPLLSSF